MTEPANHTFVYPSPARRELDRLHSDVGERFDRIALRLEGHEVETTGLKAILDRHERGLADPKRRLAELEDAAKG